MEIKEFPIDRKEMRLFFDWLIVNNLSCCYSFKGWARLKNGNIIVIGDLIGNEL